MLAPTRELALQTAAAAQGLAPRLKTLALVGGTVPAGLLAEVSAWLQANQAVLIEEWKSWQV